MIDDPKELLGQRLDIVIQIKSARLPLDLCTDSYIEYEMATDGKCQNYETFRTQQVMGRNQNPQYNYRRHHTFEIVTEEVIQYLQTKNICFCAYAYQQSDKQT